MAAKSMLPIESQPKRVLRLGQEYVVKLSAGRAVISLEPVSAPQA